MAAVMYAVERRGWIVSYAREHGRVDVAAVAESLEVARETVRRDLSALENEGVLRRVHGGAIPVERAGFEGHLTSRATVRQDLKTRIAAQAVTLLAGAEMVYFDEGSTSQAVAERFQPDRAVTVVTNALPVATILAVRDNLDVILVGGRVRRKTLGAVDHWAVRMLDEFVFDMAVVGSNGVTLERGLSCPDANVAAVKARAVVGSRRTMLVADSSKFGVDSTYRFAQVRDLDTIVTDKGANEGALRRIRAVGVDVVTA